MFVSPIDFVGLITGVSDASTSVSTQQQRRQVFVTDGRYDMPDIYMDFFILFWQSYLLSIQLSTFKQWTSSGYTMECPRWVIWSRRYKNEIRNAANDCLIRRHDGLSIYWYVHNFIDITILLIISLQMLLSKYTVRYWQVCSPLKARPWLSGT